MTSLLSNKLQFRTARTRFAILLITLLPALSAIETQAQNVDIYRPKASVAVLLPLQLDSIFKGTQYSFGNSIPKWVMPALEFYHGLQLAADSLSKEGIEADIRVIDSRKNGSLALALEDPVLENAGLIIGMAQSSADLKMMADFAKGRKIPFISATYPSDARITNNGQMIMLNSTLKTHCEGIYKYLQANHSTDKLTLITRNGSVESYLKTWLEEAAASTKSVKLDWKVVNLPDSFRPAQLQNLLDSNRTNTLIGATLDRDFSLRLIRSAASLSSKYKVNIFGMPTWDEYTLNRSEFKGSTVFFSTPFVSYSANATLYNLINKRFAQMVNSKPSDMAFKGFEIVYRFTKTLYHHNSTEAFLQHVNSKEARVFSDYNVLPNYASDGTVSYLENKKLYFVKKADGNIVWVGQ